MRKYLLFIATLVVLSLSAAGSALADQRVEVKAGPIWDNDDAQIKCEALLDKVAQKYAGRTVSWDGTWRTTIEGKESVCAFVIED